MKTSASFKANTAFSNALITLLAWRCRDRELINSCNNKLLNAGNTSSIFGYDSNSLKAWSNMQEALEYIIQNTTTPAIQEGGPHFDYPLNVWILISVRFYHFLFFRLKRNVKHSKQCLITFPNISKFVKILCYSFSISLEMWWNTVFHVSDITYRAGLAMFQLYKMTHLECFFPI